jgi:F-type H+-transporting ATPase subunit epsilon
VSDERRLTVEMVTPDGSVYRGEASMVIVPGIEGELGFLPQHEPLVALSAIGETRVQLPDGVWQRFATGIGYIQVLFDKVLLVVDQAEQADRIDVARAEAARKRAEDRLARRDDPGAQAEVDFYKAEQALRRAENRLRVAARV